MIPGDFIAQWRKIVPWALDTQIEQDLVITRALIEIFSREGLAQQLAFRGGTALYKLYLLPPARYSEDLDFVQINAGPIGSCLDDIRGCLDPWLGNPKRFRSEGGVTLLYSFPSETDSTMKLRLKIEINSREHFSVYGFKTRKFKATSHWISGEAEVQTYSLDELLGTKLRALYQRRKGRDLFDIWLGLTVGNADSEKVVNAFVEYTSREGKKISQREFLLNLEQKARMSEFMADTRMVLAPGFEYDSEIALEMVKSKLLSLL